MLTASPPSRVGKLSDDQVKAGLAQLASLRAFMRERVDMPAQYIVTFLLVATSEGHSVGEYAARANVSRSVMSRHILDLSVRQRSGEPGLDLLYTRASPNNLRMHEVFLTDRGKHIMSAMADAWRMTQ
jgi:DNA-binding MarR family transcriptional regulator